MHKTFTVAKVKLLKKNLCANKKKLAKNTGESILRNTAAACCQVAPVVSNSVRPHGLQPTKLLHPWDFPGNSTGVGCHCLLPAEYYEAVKKNADILFHCTGMKTPPRYIIE